MRAGTCGHVHRHITFGKSQNEYPPEAGGGDTCSGSQRALQQGGKSDSSENEDSEEPNSMSVDAAEFVSECQLAAEVCARVGRCVCVCVCMCACAC